MPLRSVMPNVVTISILLFGLGVSTASAIPVDLNTFLRVPDPSIEDVITVEADGSRAVLAEALSGDTFLIRSDLAIPVEATGLSFSFLFSEPDPLFEDNAFRALLYDPGTCDPGLDPSCAFFTAYHDASASGDVTWDFTGTSLPGSTAALSFGLLFGNFDFDLGSTLEIASVDINERVSQVPEPSAFVLIAAGLGSALLFNRALARRRT